MKKVFISQPMNGKTQEQIKNERERLINMAKNAIDEEIEIIDSYFDDYNPDDGCIPLKYLAKSIELLADADVAYFGKKWSKSRGCKIEFVCARDYGIEIIQEVGEVLDI